MEDLSHILSMVTEEPVDLQGGTEAAAFPGCIVYSFDNVALQDGFELGDFMNESTVSVSQEVFAVDVSLSCLAPNKAMHVVWRIALKSGRVGLFRLRLTGKEDSVFNDIVIEGEGLVIDDLELEPFAQARMIEIARRRAFSEIEAITKSAASLAWDALALFKSNSGMATTAAARLELADKAPMT